VADTKDARGVAPSGGTPGGDGPTLNPAAWAEQIEGDESLDANIDQLEQALPSWLTTGDGRRALSGRWLGHSLHPLLTDLPIGFWTSASLLDLLGPRRNADTARRLVGLGVLSALPTAAAGLSDWTRLDGPDKRVGFVHAQLNTVALLLYGWSYLARRRHRRMRGVLLGLAGGMVATAGGYLGSHLTLTRAVTRDGRLADS
jgi:uncharacterized membrane protein